MKALFIMTIVVMGFALHSEATEKLRRVQPKRQGSQPKIEKQKTLEELQKEHTLQEWVKQQKEAGKQVPYVYSPSNSPSHNVRFGGYSTVRIYPKFQNLTDYSIKGLYYTVKVTDTFDNLLTEDTITEMIDIAPWCSVKATGALEGRFDTEGKLISALEDKMVKVTITVKKVQWANGKTTENYPAQPAKETTENQPKESQ